MRINDFGPLYAETDLTRFPVEPFNTYSNLIFLIVSLYFLQRTKFQFTKFPLLVTAIPILFIGFIGGTLYHATRGWNLWLVMDYLPIIVLATLASIAYWIKIWGCQLKGILSGLGSILLARTVLLADLPFGLRITAGYGLVALSIIVPIAVYSLKHAQLKREPFVLAVAYFITGLSFRFLDAHSPGFLPMGTHFLWHLCGGASVFYLMTYVYSDESALSEKHARKLSVAAP